MSANSKSCSRRQFLHACWCCAAISFARPLLSAQHAPRLRVTALAPDIWTHTSWKLLKNGEAFSSSGLIVKGFEAGLIIDTTWSTDDMAPLIEKSRALTRPLPLSLGVTHAHDDRMSGLEIARASGIPSFAYHLTQRDAPARGLPIADTTWVGSKTVFDLGGRSVEFFHPGPAHTRDNVVAFIEDAGVLFGGCMIRTSGLGNVADANIGEWPVSMDRLIAEYGARTSIVVPGHGDPAGPDMLNRTRALVLEAATR